MLGNKVSAMLVSLATQIADPVERFTTIAAGTRLAKDQARVLSEELIQGWAQLAFPALSSRIARLAGNLRLFDHVPPLFNVLVSNIVGPDFAVVVRGGAARGALPGGSHHRGGGPQRHRGELRRRLSTSGSSGAGSSYPRSRTSATI